MPGQTIRLVDTEGNVVDADPQAAASALQDPRWHVATTDDELGRVAQQAKEEVYGGAGGAVKAGAAALARGASLGGSDVLARAIGGEDAAIALEGLRDVNPGVSIGGELIGAVAPALLTGGASAGASAGEAGAALAARGLGRGLASALPSAAVGRLGAGIARAGAEAGALGKLGGAIAGGAAEGALFGAGQGASELALSRDPLTAERAVSAIGSNALFGAAAGGALGAAGNLVERGLGKAKGVIDDALARRAAKEATAAEAIASGGDLSLLDPAKLKAARQQEVDAIIASRAPQREAIVEDLKAYRDSAYKDDLFEQHFGISDGFIREAGGSLKSADRKIRNLLDVEVALSKHPERAYELLQQQEQALQRLNTYARDDIEELSSKIEQLPTTIRDEIKAGKIEGYVYGKGGLTDEGVDLAVQRELPGRADQLRAERQKLYDIANTTSPALGRNRDLQARITNVVDTPPASDRLRQIDEAIAAASHPTTPSLGAAVLSAALPFSGPLGAAAAFGGRALGGLKQVGAAVTRKTGEALSGGLGRAASLAAPAASAAIPAAPPIAHLIGERDAATVHGLVSGRIDRATEESAARTGAAVAEFVGASKPSKYKPVVATEVLSGTRFGAPQPRGRTAASDERADTTSLPALFKARTDEIKRQTAYDVNGIPRIRQEAREAIAARLRPVAALDPIAADRMETIAVRRLEYLSSIIPRRPDFGLPQIGRNQWQPSDMEIRSWARSVSAVEDPGGVEERAVHGALTPEDAEAYWTVYPERAETFKRSLLERPELAQSLPYGRRLMLSMFVGAPLDPSLHPDVIAYLQGQFVAEPGTESGTQAPRAQPRFGSVKKLETDTTPSQERAKGNR